MRPIVSITLNPALDISTRVDAVTAGPKLRCAAPRRDPGGGGINVSRVVAELEGSSLAFVALGGATGQAVEAMLREDGQTLSVFSIDGETRQSLSVIDAAGQQYRFVMPGPEWGQVAVERALSQMRDVTPEGALVVFSGSLPPGVAADFPQHFCETLKGRDLVFDLSGSALERFVGLETGAFLLRMDQGEGETLHGGALTSAEETAAFARGLVERGAAERVIIARGAEGSVLVNADGAWAVKAADVQVNSKTGAGDSFVGAMVFGLASGMAELEAFSLGAAAASATVTTSATELCHRDMVYELLPECGISEV